MTSAIHNNSTLEKQFWSKLLSTSVLRGFLGISLPLQQVVLEIGTAIHPVVP